MIGTIEVPLTYTKAGRLDKNTREAIASAKAMKMIPRPSAEQMVDAAGILALTVAYKYTVITWIGDIVNWITNFKPGAAIEWVWEGVTGGGLDFLGNIQSLGLGAVQKFANEHPETASKEAEEVYQETWGFDAVRLAAERNSIEMQRASGKISDETREARLKLLEEKKIALEEKKADPKVQKQAVDNLIERLEMLEWAEALSMAIATKWFLQPYTPYKAIENVPLVE